MAGTDHTDLKSAPRGLVFVHVSDIHFHFKQNGNDLDRDADIAHELVLDAGRVTGELGRTDGVWVNGDIAYHGKADEYALAKEWLGRLCDSVRCERTAVWTVPGNHDVQRSTPPSVRDTLIQALRDGTRTAANDTLRGHLESEDAHIFFRGLTHYNEFASAFECATTPIRPAWHDDLPLSEGYVLRLHGVNSALCSNSLDDDGSNKLVLGEFQLTALRNEDGVVHVAMCHHPTNWLLDARDVEPLLNARARIQLYGHEHEEVVTTINGSLRVVAGAVSPSRTENHWQPRYSILNMFVASDEDQWRLVVRMFARAWDPTTRRFVAASGESPREHRLSVPQGVVPSRTIPSGLADSKAVPALDQLTGSEELAGRPVRAIGMRPERVLTYRFFELPYSVRLEVAVCLGLTADQDQGVTDPELTRRFFERATQKKVLGELWEELRQRLGLPVEPNPFRQPPAPGDRDA